MNRETKEQKERQEDLIDITVFLSDYFRLFSRMWKVVLFLMLAGAAFFGIRANAQYHARYTASSTFTVNITHEQGEKALSGSFFDNAAAEQMAKTFPHILTSGVLQRRVAEQLSMDAVPGSIRVRVTKNTNLLTLSVTDIDAERAYRTLQAVIDCYPSVSEVIVGKVELNMLDETEIPTQPDNPKTLKRDAAKGGLLGLAAGLAFLAVLVFFNQTIRREEDCAKKLNQRCLGMIPKMHHKKRSRKKEVCSSIADEKIKPEFVEAFRIIRNKVEYSARENGIKSILVTSALADEGKSTVAVNLALSLVQNGKKVALIDCDLRNPSDSNVLQLGERKGLSEYLKGGIKLNEAVVSGREADFRDFPKLLYLPAGSAVLDGTELLDTPAMKRAIESLEEEADYVILDSAPLGLLADAGILAQYVDGALLVVKKDFARADFIFRGLEQLAEYKVHIMGCVLNEN